MEKKRTKKDFIQDEIQKIEETNWRRELQRDYQMRLAEKEADKKLKAEMRVNARSFDKTRKEDEDYVKFLKEQCE